MLPGRRHPGELRLGAERAQLLPGRQPDGDELPGHELELLRAGRVHQEPRATRRSGPPASPPRCSCTTGTTATTARSAPASSPTPRCATTRSSAASPGTATSATRRSARRCTTSTRRCGSSAPSTPAAPGSATSTTRTWPTSSTTPATGAAALVKWSLALNQNMGPHNGGCGTCTGLITVQEGGARAGQVDYTIEYYTTGHLTKFVRPGRAADRLHRQRHGAERRLAQHRRLQGADRAQRRHRRAVGAGRLGRTVVHVHAAGAHHRDVHLVRHPGRRRRRRRRGPAPITGLAGKCLDVAGASSADGTAVQLYDCNGTAAQQWTLGTRRHGPGARQVPRRRADNGTANGTRAADLGLHRRRQPAVDGHRRPRPDQRQRRQVPRRDRQQLRQRHARRRSGRCTGGANQKWTVP